MQSRTMGITDHILPLIDLLQLFYLLWQKSKMLQEFTYTHAYEAMKIMYLIETMSGWYFDVSSKVCEPLSLSIFI